MPNLNWTWKGEKQLLNPRARAIIPKHFFVIRNNLGKYDDVNVVLGNRNRFGWCGRETTKSTLAGHREPGENFHSTSVRNIALCRNTLELEDITYKHSAEERKIVNTNLSRNLTSLRESFMKCSRILIQSI